MQIPPSFNSNSRISLGEIAAHLADARNDKKEATRNDTLTCRNQYYIPITNG